MDLSRAELDLDAIEARAEAATPGPWNYDLETEHIYETRGAREIADCYCDQPKSQGNVAFIAESRTDVPALVRELREARRERDELASRLVEQAKEHIGARDEARAALAASEKRCAALLEEIRGYVSPEQHAEVVRERDGFRELMDIHATGERTLMGQLRNTEALLAEVTAQVAVTRKALERLMLLYEDEHVVVPSRPMWLREALAPTDAGKALAERVKLLEAVAEKSRALVDQMSYAEGSLAEAADHALAALDAHGKQEERHE